MERTPEQQAEGQAIIKVLAAVLERLVCANASLARSDPGQVTKFHALKSPGIGILPYLDRIHKYSCCSNECFILALIYIDRLIQRNNFLLTDLNVHRVVITAILLAAKFFDDAYYNNAYYAKVGGVLGSEMNGLEVDFLFRINFSLHVTPEVFEKYKAELVAHSVSTSSPVPHAPSPIPEEIETNRTAAFQPLTSGPVPMQHEASSQHMPSVVSPSPHMTAGSQNVTAPLAAPCPVEAAPVPYSSFPTVQVAPKDFTQQFMQRANSLPYPARTGRCMESQPVYNSAPMVSMVPVDAEQYLVVNNQIYPLQKTLVHHNHGAHEQTGFHHQNGYALPREGVGSLVAGHY
eukprot:scaffold18886_cov108-Cylindrotheca_fusiformis.AAC.2